jgi:hypothetical protein
MRRFFISDIDNKLNEFNVQKLRINKNDSPELRDKIIKTLQMREKDSELTNLHFLFYNLKCNSFKE